jgi:hypothetical protein
MRDSLHQRTDAEDNAGEHESDLSTKLVTQGASGQGTEEASCL